MINSNGLVPVMNMLVVYIFLQLLILCIEVMVALSVTLTTLNRGYLFILVTCMNAHVVSIFFRAMVP